MKVARLLHNPGAGDEEHTEDDLVSLIEANGFECRYSSTKGSGWKDLEADLDFVIAAGGDGTVRKITKELLNRKVIEQTFPIALLPLGTANNIAKTLEIEGEAEEVIKSWRTAVLKKYDVGSVEGLKDGVFFMESLGYGLFPYLMQEMKKLDEKLTDDPEKKLKAALDLLLKITATYKPGRCQLTIDGKDFSGQFLMVEVMNTRSIGPNLVLSPDGDPGDGVLEVITVPESDRRKFADYVAHKLNGEEATFTFNTVKAKVVEIVWVGTHLHVDDEVLKISEKTLVKIEIKPGLLEFLVRQ
jgi:diacylglycerol kinase (ATP)